MVVNHSSGNEEANQDVPQGTGLHANWLGLLGTCNDRCQEKDLKIQGTLNHL